MLLRVLPYRPTRPTRLPSPAGRHENRQPGRAQHPFPGGHAKDARDGDKGRRHQSDHETGNDTDHPHSLSRDGASRARRSPDHSVRLMRHATYDGLGTYKKGSPKAALFGASYVGDEAPVTRTSSA